MGPFNSDIILGRLIQTLVTNDVLSSHDVWNIMHNDGASLLTPEDIAKGEWENAPFPQERRNWEDLPLHTRQLLVRRVVHREQFSNSS